MGNSSDEYPDRLDIKTTTIAASASLSSFITLGVGTPAMIEMPSAWDAASITFQTSIDGTVFQDYYDTLGNEVTVIAVASRNIKQDVGDFAGAKFIKIRSGTSAVPVNQTSLRTIRVSVRVL